MSSKHRRTGSETDLARAAKGLIDRYALDGLTLAVLTPDLTLSVETGSLTGDSLLPLGAFGKPLVAGLLRSRTTAAQRREARPVAGHPEVSVEHLLCHTSGLAESAPAADGARRFVPVAPGARPGRIYSYSSAGFGAAVDWYLRGAGAEPRDLPTLLAAELGLRAVARRGAVADVAEDLVASLTDLRRLARRVATQLVGWGAGGVGDEVILAPAQATAELWAGSPWFWSLAGGDLALQHGGIAGDAAVLFLAVPHRQLVTMVAATGPDAAAAQAEGTEVLSRLLGVTLHPTLPALDTRPPDFAGTFRHGDRLCVARAQGGCLDLRVDGADLGPHRFVTPDAFVADAAVVRNPRYAGSVMRGPGGSVVGLRLDERAYLSTGATEPAGGVRPLVPVAAHDHG